MQGNAWRTIYKKICIVQLEGNTRWKEKVLQADAGFGHPHTHSYNAHIPCNTVHPAAAEAKGTVPSSYTRIHTALAPACMLDPCDSLRLQYDTDYSVCYLTVWGLEVINASHGAMLEPAIAWSMKKAPH